MLVRFYRKLAGVMYNIVEETGKKADRVKKEQDCFRCSHFYVTWDTRFPYGCRDMGFKSKSLPGMVTRQIAGQKCLSFQEKAEKK